MIKTSHRTPRKYFIVEKFLSGSLYAKPADLKVTEHGGAGGGIRARDFWTWAFGHHLCSPDYESGALARLGYPGNKFSVILIAKASFKSISA